MKKKEFAHRLFHNNKYNKNIEILVLEILYFFEVIIFDVVIFVMLINIHNKMIVEKMNCVFFNQFHEVLQSFHKKNRSIIFSLIF